MHGTPAPLAEPIPTRSATATSVRVPVEVAVADVVESWHDSVYAEAAGEETRVPWFRGGPDPELLEFLSGRAQEHVRPGARCIVVGCGLGDDVAELRARGFDAVGVDVSACAVDWARRRWGEHADAFRVVDVRTPPSCHCRRFDLVVEIHTLQSVPEEPRAAVAAGIARLVHPRGVVLGVWRAAGDESDEGAEIASRKEPAGPPWALSAPEYQRLMELAGLRSVGAIEPGSCDHRGRARLRGVFAPAV